MHALLSVLLQAVVGVKNMPIILWLLGVPLIVVIALMVAHVI
jgi:hypothetical protein